jgi:hypothetical protein
VRGAGQQLGGVQRRCSSSISSSAPTSLSPRPWGPTGCSATRDGASPGAPRHPHTGAGSHTPQPSRRGDPGAPGTHAKGRSRLPDFSRPAMDVEAPGLTAWITRAASWEEVALLLARYGRQLNHIHLAAALVRLAHVDGGGSSDSSSSSSSSSSSTTTTTTTTTTNSSSSSSSANSTSRPSSGSGGGARRPAAGAASPPPLPTTGRPANWRPFLRDLTLQLAAALPDCGPRQLSNALWAMARLGYAPEAEFVNAWSERMGAACGAASARDASNTLWALAKLQLRPRARLLQQLLSALHRGVTQGVPGGGGRGGDRGGGGHGGATAQDASNALWALATLRLEPPPELLSSLCVALQRAHTREARGLGAQELANFLWAAGEIHERARARALGTDSGGGGGGREFAGGGGGATGADAAWGAGSGGAAVPLPVPPAWLDEQLSRAARRLEGWETRHLVMALSAAARLRRRPPDIWLSGCLRALRPRLGHCCLQVGALRCHGWRGGVGGATRRERGGRRLLPRGQCNTVQRGRARTTTQPPSQRSLARSRGRRPLIRSPLPPNAPAAPIDPPQSSLRPPPRQDLADIFLSLGALRACPFPDWTDAALAAAAPRLAAGSPGALTSLAKGVARLRLTPGPEWWAEHDAAAARHLAACRYTPAGLADAAAAKADAGGRRPPAPPEAWGAAWLDALETQLPGLSARGLAKAAWAGARLGLQPGGRLKEALAAAVGAPGVLEGLPTGDAVRLTWALVKLHVDAAPGLADRLALQLCRRAGGMAGSELGRAAWALARLGARPRRELLVGFAELAEARAGALGLLGGGGSGGGAAEAPGGLAPGGLAPGAGSGGSGDARRQLLSQWLWELRAPPGGRIDDAHAWPRALGAAGADGGLEPVAPGLSGARAAVAAVVG